MLGLWFCSCFFGHMQFDLVHIHAKLNLMLLGNYLYIKYVFIYVETEQGVAQTIIYSFR